MYEIRKLTDMEAAFDFYHTYSVATTAEVSDLWRDKTNASPPLWG